MRHLNDVKFRGYYPHWKDYDDMESGWVIGLLYYDFSDEEYGIQNEDGIYFVDHKSIGQYTGLKDKNGIKIYDGDILVTKSELNQPRGVLYHKIIGKVIKEKGMVYLEGKSINGFIEEGLEINDYKILLLSPRIYEVIGNIYENPELLEVN